jgi:hypothetical protein
MQGSPQFARPIALRTIADAGGWRDLKQVLHYTQASRAGIGARAQMRELRLQRAAALAQPEHRTVADAGKASV